MPRLKKLKTKPWLWLRHYAKQVEAIAFEETTGAAMAMGSIATFVFLSRTALNNLSGTRVEAQQGVMQKSMTYRRPEGE